LSALISAPPIDGLVSVAPKLRTPGQIVSGVACIAEGHAGSPDETREWMSGNICRCGA
jgi:hypothetical protein